MGRPQDDVSRDLEGLGIFLVQNVRWVGRVLGGSCLLLDCLRRHPLLKATQAIDKGIQPVLFILWTSGVMVYTCTNPPDIHLAHSHRVFGRYPLFESEWGAEILSN